MWNNQLISEVSLSSLPLSNEYKVIEALQKKLKNVKIKLYNVNDFQKNDAWNAQLLNIFKEEINKNDGLRYYEEDLVYDINKFTFSKYLKHDDKSITVKIKYFQKEFEVLFLWDHDITNVDYINVLKNFIENNSKKLLLQEWNLPATILNKSKIWIKKLINDYKNELKVNTNQIEFDVEKFNIFMIGLNEWKNIKTISVTFDYDDSDIVTFSISLNPIVKIQDLKNVLNDWLKINFKKNGQLQNINYKNFWAKISYEQILKSFEKFLSINNKLKIGSEELEINPKNFDFKIKHENKQKIQLNPWIRTFVLPLTFKIEQTEISLDFPIEFLDEINYSEIQHFFQKKLEDYKLNFLKWFSSASQEPVLLGIKDEITKIFNNKIMIDNQQYDLDLSNLKIINYQYDWTVNPPVSNITLYDSKLGKSNFVVKIKIDYYEKTLSKVLFLFLQKFNRTNLIDLNYQINEQANWTQFIKLIQKVIGEKLPANPQLLEKINFKIVDNEKDLATQIGDYHEDNKMFPITLILNFQDFDSEKCNVYFKNISLTNSFVTKKIKQHFANDINTNQNDFWPLWAIETMVSNENLGLLNPKKYQNLIINYKIIGVDLESGKVNVEIQLKIANYHHSFPVVVQGFLSSKQIGEKLSLFLKKPYIQNREVNVLNKNNLTTKSTHLDALNTLQNLIKQNFSQQYHNYIKLYLNNDEEQLLVNNPSLSITAFINLTKVAGTFNVENIYLHEVIDFKDQFIKTQQTKRKTFYPDWSEHTIVTVNDLGIIEPINKQEIKIEYKIKQIDYEKEQIIMTVNASKNNTAVKFDLIIQDFYGYKKLFNDVSKFFEKTLTLKTEKVESLANIEAFINLEIKTFFKNSKLNIAEFFEIKIKSTIYPLQYGKNTFNAVIKVKGVEIINDKPLTGSIFIDKK